MVVIASKNHRLVKEILDKIIKEYSQKNKPFPILEKIKTIKLNDPDTKEVIDYEPDYAIQRNISKHSYYYVVFEVIDGQRDYKTMADVARILAKPEIRKAIFLSGSSWKKRETDRITSVLIGCYKNRFRKKSKKDIINLASKQILKTDTKEEIKKMILKEIKQFLP